jgi:putative DNA primase/helicase
MIEVGDQVTVQVFRPKKRRLAEDARPEVAQNIRDFLLKAEQFHIDSAAGAVERIIGLDFNAPPKPPVHAARYPTGMGKTQGAVSGISYDRGLRRGRGDDDVMARAPWLYAASTHRLSDEIAPQFEAKGLSALVFRGREADNPDGGKMCQNLSQVKTAIAAGAPVQTTCCKSKGKECPFFQRCAYQSQLRQRPDVLLVPHEILFHAHGELPEPAGVIIDEDFWQDGTRTGGKGLRIDDIEYGDLVANEDLGLMESVRCARRRLAGMLRSQESFGGLERQTLGDVSEDNCSTAISNEWKLIGKAIKIYPGMPDTALRKIPTSSLANVALARRIIGVFRGCRELIRNPDIERSGRVVIAKTKTGTRQIFLNIALGIATKWEAPTFIMSATLPALEIIQPFYPQVELVADIDVEAPHMRVTQIINAPVAKSKIGKDGAPRNQVNMRRLLLMRWLATDRQPMLAVVQQEFEEYIRQNQLPKDISVEHFNNIAGLDKYRNVRHLVTIGRTQPRVEAVEAYSGALTGRAPLLAEANDRGARWHTRVPREIRLPEGKTRTISCEQHPDAAAEACRANICEGGLIQAIGRARGINRKVLNQVDVTIVADIALPLTVTEVIEWSPPSAAVEMAGEGVMLFSPADMVRAFPQVWANEKAADRTLQDTDDVEAVARLFAGVPTEVRGGTFPL